MYAVIGTWSLDAGRRDEQLRGLQEEVMPMVENIPGFVKGHWAANISDSLLHTFLGFDTREHAASFADYVSNDEDRIASRDENGIQLIGELVVAEVIGDAG